MKIYHFSILLFSFVAFTSYQGNAQVVDVTIQDITAITNNRISVPIEVSDLTGLTDENGFGVISYQFQVDFDNNVLNAVGVDSVGALTENWYKAYYNISIDEQIIVGSFGTTSLSGSGVLIKLIFDVIGGPGSFTDLMFSNFNFNGGGINVNCSNGSVTVTAGIPETINDLTIEKEGGNSVRLSWSSSANATAYDIYRGTSPYFTSATPVASTADLSFIDDNKIGDPNTNYYYYVIATNGSIESGISNRVGEFDFELITTATTDWSAIALPLGCNGLNMASDLMSAIPGSDAIAYWNADNQGYEQFISILPELDFDIYPGHPYSVNVATDGIFTLLGAYATQPGYSLIYNSNNTSFNGIMLPLNREDITLASELLPEIQGCDAVAFWNANEQGYEQFIEILPELDFPVRVGYPYYVNITNSSTVWPTGLEKNKMIVVNNKLKSDVQKRSVPHLVYGEIKQPFQIDPSKHNYIAYIKSRKLEILTDQSVGCGFSKNGRFWVQCSNFITNWSKGEELYIEVYDKLNNQLLQTYHTILTYNSSDRAFLLKDVTMEDNSFVADYRQIIRNYPNPFNAETKIDYKIKKSGYVKLDIYNSMGQKVRTLVNEKMSAGHHSIVWNAKSDDMYDVTSGVYFCRLLSNNIQTITKVILMR